MNKSISARWWAGLAIGLLGAICFSTKAVIVKLAYRDTAVDPVTLLALRMVFSLPFFLGAAWFTSRKESNVRFSGNQWILVIFLGCLGYYISSYLDFLGLKYVSAGIERLILFVYPTIVVIISAFAFRQKISKRQLLALGITYLGLSVAFVSEATINTSPEFYLGAGFIFLCAITFATYIAGSGKLIPKIGSVKFNSYAMAAASVAVLIHYFIHTKGSLFGLSSLVYFYSFLMAIISTVIPSYLVAISLNRIGANNTAIVASIGPVSTILQAWWLLDESVSGWQIIGTLLILCGILLVSWKGSQLMENEPLS